jgi:alpha-amylase
MRFFYSLLAFVLHVATLITAADTNAWKSRSIYFALTDRVARSNSDSGGSSCGNLGDYCGGTFKGLEGKLDYIKGMGFDAIWITPVIASKCRCSSPLMDEQGSSVGLTVSIDSAGGYHGYWAQDLYAVNSKYGNADDLKSLVRTAHSKVNMHPGNPISLNQ